MSGNRGRGGGGGGGDRGRGRGGGGGGPPRGRGGPPGGGGGGGGGPPGGGGGGSGFRGRGGGGGDFRGRGGEGRGGFGGGGGGGRGGFRGRGGSTFSNAPLIFSPTPNVPTREDARVGQANELIGHLQKTKGVGPERPVRPGYGTQGKAIVVRANFFAIDVKKDKFFEYSVEIKPEPKSQKPRVKRRILELFEASPAGSAYRNHLVHDGSQRLISAKVLPQPLTGTVKYYESGDNGPHRSADTYEVTVTYTKELPTAPLKKYLEGDVTRADADEQVDPVISALNLVLQRQASESGFRHGRNRFFFDDNEKGQLGPRLDALMGFYSSVRPVHKQLMVNLNVCMTAFHQPGNLLDAIRSFDRGSFGGNTAEFMRDVKVSTRHLGYKRVKKIARVVSLTARTQRFKCSEYNNEMISVEEYFKRKYKITLRAADAPLIDVGGPGKATYFPAELCMIEPGEPHLGKLSPTETSNMLNVANRRPAVNALHITQQGIPKLGFTGNPTLDAFGVSISPNMTVIPARELPPPRVTYGQGRPSVANGSWNIMDVKFHHGAKINKWGVLVVIDGQPEFQGPTDQRLKDWIIGFRNKCTKSGMTVAAPPAVKAVQLPPPSSDPGRVQAARNLENQLRTFGEIDIVLVLLQRRDDYIYPAVKRICAVTLGLHSQCVLTEKAFKERGQDQYFSNVALKVNMKLGGENHRLDPNDMKWLQTHKTMMVGIDVTHPGPSSVRGTPSIAGVVASVDQHFGQFPVSLRLQKSKQEGIAELADMMIERLLAFRARSKVLPERIFIFRDGVSEGQYDKVLKEELPQVFEAFKRVDAKNPRYQPKLSIVICGKRHHARFYPTSDTNADNKNGNTKPGTVVDKGVTSVMDYDFYLQAHFGLQGTVRPTHYVVIYDENGLSPDTIQQGVHVSSYMYARATKAVSLCPAAYYADVVCEQARFWIHGFLNLAHEGSSAGDSASVAGGTPSERMKRKREDAEKNVYDAAVRMWGNGLHPRLKNSMFYL